MLKKASRRPVLGTLSAFLVDTRSISYSKYPQYYKTGHGKGINFRVQGAVSEDVDEYMQQNNLKPKEHPGIFHLPKVSLPEKFRHAVEKIVSNHNVRALAENAGHLRDKIWSRNLPLENEFIQAKTVRLLERARKRDEVLLPFLSQEETVKLEKKTEAKVLRKLHRDVNHWQPIKYTSREVAFEYLLARSAPEYAALVRIFNEISKRNNTFQPKTLCDFGSGIGTVSWAARSYWESSLLEHLCADMSWEMNELAELILRGGNKNNDHEIPALFFRQHLPESYKIRYDLVVSAFSLLELPSAKERLQIIDKLWNKTDQYLVIVEPGTKAGFRAIMEARDYILGLGYKTKSRNCHVFSPCPSSNACPRFAFDTIPCNFEVKYRPIYPFHHDGSANELISYVVIKRGKKDPEIEEWPRLVEEPLIRSKHVICRLCTKESQLTEVVLTRKKHVQSLRLIAKRSGWGDLLPIQLSGSNPVDNFDKYDDNDDDVDSELKEN